MTSDTYYFSRKIGDGVASIYNIFNPFESLPVVQVLDAGGWQVTDEVSVLVTPQVIRVEFPGVIAKDSYTIIAVGSGGAA